MAGEAEFFKESDSVIIDVHLVPCQPVTGRDWIGMVVVVPSLAAGQQGYPLIVPRIVTGGKTSPALQMRDGIDHPCDVKAEGYRQSRTP